MTPERTRLDQSIPDGLRALWADQLAAASPTGPPAPKIRCFVFRVGGEWFGLEPQAISLTLPDARPRQLPHRADGAVEGLINADGRIVVCLRLAGLWDIFPASQPPPNRRVLVLAIDGWSFAVRADDVMGIEEIAENTMESLSPTASDALRRCARGTIRHDGKTVTLLQTGPFAEEVRKRLQ